MRSSARWLGLVALIAALSTTACVAQPAPPPGSASPTAAVLPAVAVQAPAEAVTVVSDADAGSRSAGVSAALFASSPVALLLASDTPADRLAAASAAVALGVPLLEVGADGAPTQGELERLSARHVVVWGDAEDAVPDGVAVHPAGGTTADLSRVLGVELTEREATGGPLAAVLELAPEDRALLIPADDASPTPTAEPGDALPRVSRGEPADGVVVLLTDADLAAAATARAAGARAVALPADAVDPQRSPDAIAALSDERTVATVAVGAAFAAVPALDWRLRSAAGGWQLPGGGQRLFPGHLMVAIYGTPGAPVLGVLGEQELGASIERARSFADPYRPLTDRTVLPAFEIITTVASESAGGDGDYSNEIDLESLRPWVEEAGRQGVYVILDLQPGRGDFVSQAREYEPLLRYPWVGLAVDPEWRLKPNERHLQVIGEVGADEVNALADYLAGLVRASDLPPKLLVLHQFRTDMLPDRERIRTDHPELDLLVHVDGQGSQPDKQATWNHLRQGALIDRWGWKNFLDEDAPVLTPEQTMAQVQPAPDLITYQ